MGKVIAIDGPSGAGKGTIARLLAERLGFHYLDTGALYRAVALHLRRNLMSDDSSDAAILDALKGVSIVFRDVKVYIKKSGDSAQRTSSDNLVVPPENSAAFTGEDVSAEIRTTEVGHYASVFSVRKVVRDFLLSVQRDAALDDNIVAEGRDMTTVVFPDAWKKFYLDADEKERARRRFLQLKDKNPDGSLDEAFRDVRERDTRDSSRDIAPLKKCDACYYIDTTNMSITEVVEKILTEVNKGHNL